MIAKRALERNEELGGDVTLPPFPLRQNYADDAAWGAAYLPYHAAWTALTRDPVRYARWQAVHHPPRPEPPEPAPSPYDLARERWERLCQDHWRLLGSGSRQPLSRPELPSWEALRAWAWALISPDTRGLIAAILLDLLAPAIGEITMAVVREAIGR
jgi:hypothetical protein